MYIYVMYRTSIKYMSFYTVIAIPYCLYYIAKYPEHQDRCRTEISDIMGDSQDITWQVAHILKKWTEKNQNFELDEIKNEHFCS